ncbi:uncharacterized [Tachysurus ichikawai]
MNSEAPIRMFNTTKDFEDQAVLRVYVRASARSVRTRRSMNRITGVARLSANVVSAPSTLKRTDLRLVIKTAPV